MRVLLGTGGLLKNCKYRIKLFNKQKTFMPPKNISEGTRKANETKDRRIKPVARLRPGYGREPETPALDILCRALASSSVSSSSSGRSNTKLNHGSAAISNKPPNIPLISPENIKQNPAIGPDEADSNKLEIVNCKTCHENSSGEDLESDMKLQNCRYPEATESVLRQVPSQSPEPSAQSVKPPVSAAPKEKPQQSGESSTIKPGIKEPSSSPAKADNVEPPKQTQVQDSIAKPQDKPPVKEAQDKAKAASSQSEKPQQSPPDATAIPSDSPFPPGRNPCKDGKRGNGQISKGTAIKQSSSTEEDMKSVPCPRQDEQNEQKIKGGEEKMHTKPPVKETNSQEAEPACSPVKNDDSGSTPNGCMAELVKKPLPDAVAGPKEQKIKKDDPSKSPSQSQTTKEQKIKKDDPSKSPSQSQTTKEWKQPPLPTSRFEFPLMSAFPLGRNPCRDGPRGESQNDLKGKGKESESKGKDSEAECKESESEGKKSEAKGKESKVKGESGSKEPKAESEEQRQEVESFQPNGEPILETCLSWAEMAKESCLNKTVLDALEKPKAKAEKTSVPSEKGNAQTPNKEIKGPSDHPKGSTGSKPPQSVPTKPTKEPAKSSENVKADAQKAFGSVLCNEKVKQVEASKKLKSEAEKAGKSNNLDVSKVLKTEAEKAAVSHKKSDNLEAAKNLKTETQKASASVSSKENLNNLEVEASKKLKTEAEKVVSGQDKSKNLEASKKLKTEAEKVVSGQDKSKNLEASKKLIADAEKAVSSQEKSKNLEASKQLKTGGEKAGQKKSKNLEASKIKDSKAQKDSAASKEKSKHQKEGTTEDPSKSTELRKFPAAPLHSTLEAYLASIKPLLTAKEFEKDVKLTKDFAKNEGPELQKLLEAAAESSSNWLTPRWTQAAYLAFQAPVTAFTSAALSFPIQKFQKCTDCLTFTARAIRIICEFKALVDQNNIPVAKIGNNQLDNSQFFNIFGTVRKPGRFCDTIEQFPDSNYVVVVYQNNYFQLPVISSTGNILSVTDLMEELEAIINCPLEKGDPHGLLTHDNRGNWAEAYGAMTCLPGNADTLEAIEQSLFVVCLDKYVPIPKGQGQEYTVQAHQLLHGGGLEQNSANRWMDKTIQLIVNPNGLAGFCYEHSPAECQPLAMLMDYVMEKINCESEENSEQSNSGKNSNPSKHLRFHSHDECVNMWIHVAMRNINKIANQLQMNVIEYECHGKDFITAQGLNSDSYIQMALQLAYYNMHKTVPAQYESAHLRMFVDGRTETIRSTSNESKAFLLAMKDDNVSETGKLKALQNAVDFHEKLTKRALNGEGIDRHLFGLQEMAIENGLPMPEFFNSKGYVRSRTFQLFTCHVATAQKSFMAYAPLTSDGYGCCYNPKKDKIIFAISAWDATQGVNPEQFGKAIKKSLDSLRKLIVRTGGTRMGEDPCRCEPTN